MSAPYRCIIADDDHVIAALLEQVLLDFYPTMIVCVTHNGAEVLATYAKLGADVLILDIQMPVLTGVQVVETLRARGDNVPVVLISAALQGRYNVTNDNATMFCAKPFDLNSLVATIQRMLPALVE